MAQVGTVRRFGARWRNWRSTSIPANGKLGGVPFEVIPIQHNPLFNPSLLCLYALLEGFYMDVPQLRRYGPLDGHHDFKMGLLDNSLELWE